MPSLLTMAKIQLAYIFYCATCLSLSVCIDKIECRELVISTLTPHKGVCLSKVKVLKTSVSANDTVTISCSYNSKILITNISIQINKNSTYQNESTCMLTTNTENEIRRHCDTKNRCSFMDVFNSTISCVFAILEIEFCCITSTDNPTDNFEPSKVNSKVWILISTILGAIGVVLAIFIFFMINRYCCQESVLTDKLEKTNGMVKSESYTYSGHQNIVFQDIHVSPSQNNINKVPSSNYCEIEVDCTTTAELDNDNNKDNDNQKEKAPSVYFTLDPMVTGYDRSCISSGQNKLEKGDNQEQAEVTILTDNDDPYADFTDGIYDHANRRRHNSSIEDHIYSHSVDSIYDTADHNTRLEVISSDKQCTRVYENVQNGSI